MNYHRDIGKCKKLLAVSAILFLICLPLSLKINFLQNDDWVYHKIVGNFLQGDFKLDPLSAPTFYTQGLLGMFFSIVFSVKRLPVFTLLIACANFFVFSKILTDFYKKTVKQAIPLAMLLFLNPLFLYSVLGFMTEQYSLLFLLLSFYLFKKHEITQKWVDFLIMVLFIVLGFFVRQVTLVFPLALVFYYLLNKKYKYSLLSFVAFLGIWVFYNHIFPQTAEMGEKLLQFQQLTESKHVYSLTYASLILLGAFLLPLLVAKIEINSLTIKKLLLFAAFGIILYLGLNKIFEPSQVFLREFPYFGNTFERTGFYPGGLSGTKYQFRGIYDLYKYWYIAARILVSFFISHWSIFTKKKIDFPLIFITIYLGLMATTKVFFDRYFLIIVPFAILFLVSNIVIKKYLFLNAFILFLAFFGYQLSMDFVYTNKYIWEKAEKLASEMNIEKSDIQATNAWKLSYRNIDRDYKYDFSYDSQAVNEKYACCYKLIEEKNITFPLSIFIRPKIYLYEKVEKPITYNYKFPNKPHN